MCEIVNHPKKNNNNNNNKDVWISVCMVLLGFGKHANWNSLSWADMQIEIINIIPYTVITIWKLSGM